MGLCGVGGVGGGGGGEGEGVTVKLQNIMSANF